MEKNPLEGKAPEKVWHFFHAISQIPRCSKQEGEILEWIKRFADERNLEYKSDKTGNIVVKKGASPGMEEKPTVVLQGHLDMVCEKNEGTSHNFETDPINFILDGDWLSADGTTLGADNGIGVALSLALLDSTDIPHGPIEALFTVDEETGLTGALELDPSLLSGKILLNLDTEELGVFYIGCAGGVTTEGFIPVTTEELGSSEGATPGERIARELKISGFKGGHSGMDINLGLGNALLSCGRVLQEISSKADLRLISVAGGNKHNAIPRECNALFTLPGGDAEEVRNIAGRIEEEIKKERGDVEPGFSITLNDAKLPEEQMDKASTGRIIRMMRVMPHGVYGMSRAVAGLVETSTNFAAIESQKGCCSTTVRVLTSQRSSVMSALDDIASRVIAAVELSGGAVRQFSRHPAWTPDPDSPLLATCKAAYKNYTGMEAGHAAVHAGLECGVIGDKIEGMEMISLGPEMEGVHTPKERLNIPSVEKLWGFMAELLKSL